MLFLAPPRGTFISLVLPYGDRPSTSIPLNMKDPRVVTLNDIQSSLYHFLYTPLTTPAHFPTTRDALDRAGREAYMRTRGPVPPCAIDLFPSVRSEDIKFYLEIKSLDWDEDVVVVYARQG